MYCSHCGAQNAGNAATCRICGTALAAPGPPYAGYAGPGPQPQVTQQQTSVLAIGSLVASVCGLVICLFVGQIIGIILGHMARKEIRESGGRITGDELAFAGIIVGWIGLALDVFALFVAVAYFAIVFTAAF